MVGFEIKGQIHQWLNCLWILVNLSLTVDGRSGGVNAVDLCICVWDDWMHVDLARGGVVQEKNVHVRREAGKSRDEETRKQCMKLCTHLMQLCREGWKWNWYGVHKKIKSLMLLHSTLHQTQYCYWLIYQMNTALNAFNLCKGRFFFFPRYAIVCSVVRNLISQHVTHEPNTHFSN